MAQADKSKCSNQSLFTTSLIGSYLTTLQLKTLQHSANELGIDESIAKAITDSSNQSPLYIAIDRYQQISQVKGAWFLSENIEFFMTIFKDAVEDFELIKECLDCGMSQNTVADLFGLRARNIRMILPNAIEKKAIRSRMSINTRLIIDSEIYQQKNINNLIFSPRDFAKCVIRISRLICQSGATEESRIAPTIVYLVTEEFPIKVIGVKKYWLGDSTPVEIDISSKTEPRRKKTKKSESIDEEDFDEYDNND